MSDVPPKTYTNEDLGLPPEGIPPSGAHVRGSQPVPQGGGSALIDRGDPTRTYTNEDLDLPPEGIQPRVLPPDPLAEKESKKLWNETRRAYARGDKELGDYFTGLQRENALISEYLVRQAGGDPRMEVAPNAAWTDVEVEVERQHVAQMRQGILMNQVFQAHGIDEFKAYRQDIERRYKEHNEGYFKQLTGKETPEELGDYYRQLEPVIEDFAILEEWQQRLDKMNQAMKAVDPNDRSISVYTNPETKRFAQWIGREMSSQNLNANVAGYIQSDKQEEAPGTFMQGASEYAFAPVEIVLDAVGKVVFGLGPALKALSGGTVGWGEPTNYIEAQDGTILINAGKVPGGVEFGAMMWNLFLDEELKETIARANAAKQWEMHNDSAFDSVVKGVGTGLGALFAYGKILGTTMKFGGGAGGAAARGVSAGLGKLGVSGSDRSRAIIEVIGRGLGGVSASAMVEGAMDGRPGTYQKAITHGALLVPVLVGVNAVGKWLNRSLKSGFPSMPPRFTQGISGVIEGGMFQGLEDIQGHAIFGLIADPSKSNLQRYIETMLSFGLYKGATGRGLPEFDMSSRQRARDGATDRLGVEIYRADASKRPYVEVTEDQVRAQALRGRRARERELPQKLLGERGEAVQKRLPAKIEKTADEIAKYDQKEGERSREFEERMEDEGFAERTEPKNEELRRRREQRRVKRIAEKAEGPSPDDRLFMRSLGEQAFQQSGAKQMGIVKKPEDIAHQARLEESTQRRAQAEAAGDIVGRPPTPEEHAAELKRLMELDEAEARQTEQIEAKEPGPQLPEIKGVQPNAEELMRLAGEGKLPEPPRYQPGELTGRQAEREKQQGTDPLEDPAFMQRPQSEIEAILERRTARDRRQLSDRFINDRRAADRRTEWEPIPERLEKLSGEARRQRMVELKAMEEGFVQAKDYPPKDRGPEGFELNMPVAGAPPGGRRVPGSSAEPASPHREKFREPQIGALKMRASDVIKMMGGQAGHPGIRWPGTTKPISITIPLIGQVMGPTKGTAVVVPMREGHLVSRSVGGVYDIFGNVARTKESLNVIVAAHEWGHALQRQVFFTGDAAEVVAQAEAWVANMAPDMLKDVWALLEGYPGRENLEPWRMGMEAWAEFTARKLLGDETVDAEAPTFAKFFRTWLAQPEQAHLRQSSWDPVKLALTQYMEQGFEAQADEQFRIAGEGARVIVGSVRRAMAEWFEDNVTDRFMRAWVDDTQPLKRAQERAFRAAGISMADVDIFEDPARMLDATRNMGLAQTVNFFMKGRFNLSMEKISDSEGLIDIIRDAAIGGSTKTYGLYLAHHRAWMQIRRGHDMGTPSKVYAQSVLAKSRRHPGFKDLARRTKVWTDSIIDFGVEGGLFSVEEGQKMKDAGVIYVPLIAALTGPKKIAPGRGVAERGKGTKRFKGHSQEHKDPLQAMQEVVQDMLTKTYHNMVVKALYMAGLREGMGGLVTVVDRAMVAQKFRTGEVWRSFKKVVLAELDKMAAEGKPFDKEQLLREAFGKLGPLINEAGVTESLITLFTQQNLPFGEHEGIIAFTPHLSPYELSRYKGEALRRAQAQNHKLQFLEVDEGVYKVFMGSQALRGPEHYLENPILRAIILGPAKLTRNLAVRWNPLFGLVNAGRDIAAYPVFNPRTGLGVGARAVDAIKGWPLWFQHVGRLVRDGKEDEAQQLFENSGVGMSMLWNEGVRAELRGKALDRAESLVEWIRSTLENWANFWSKGEGALRLAAMSEVYDNYKGNDPVERALLAAEAGKKSTIDFAIGGTYAKILTQMHPFITASINGMRRFVRAAAGSEGKTAEEKASNQRAAMLNAMIGMTIPQVVLAWIHQDEDWYRDKPAYMKISRIYWTENIWTPLPFELGVIAASGPQAMVDYITGANPVDFGDLLQEALFPYLKGLESFFPIAIQAPFEVKTGYGFFFDSPITPRRLQSKRPDEQVTHNTTAAAQWIMNEPRLRGLAELAGIDNAIELEHFLNGYTAGKGTVGLRAIDGLLGLKDHPGFTKHFFSRFWQPRHSRSRIVQQLYDKQAELADIKPENLTIEQRRLYRQMNQATKHFTELRKAGRTGQRTQEQIDKAMFERADAIMNPKRNR